MYMPVTGYRLRFAPETAEGEIVLYLIDRDGGPRSEILRGLRPEAFTAMAVLLANDKDHRMSWDGSTVDAGPEEA